MKKFSLKQAINALKTLWFSICCLIYDVVITYPLTRSIYKYYSKILNNTFKDKPFTMVDIGMGTGAPLKAFMKVSNASHVKAIDINKAYVRKAKKLFKNDKRVNVDLVDWYKFADETKEKFDVVFFGFSFMLMPDKKKVRKLFFNSFSRPLRLLLRLLRRMVKYFCF